MISLLLEKLVFCSVIMVLCSELSGCLLMMKIVGMVKMLV